MYHSKRYCNFILILCLSFLFTGSCTSSAKFTPKDYAGFVIQPSDYDCAKDVRWANYLYDHLNRRNIDDQCVITNLSSNDPLLTITIDLDTTSKSDFKIDVKKNKLLLTARDDEKMLWLQYQLMKQIGTLDDRIETSDLPPAIINFNQDTTGNFAFEHRGIYTPTNQDSDYRGIVATHDVEEWGIWGHQLNRIFGSDAPSETFATVRNQKNLSQYCFSSNLSFQLIKDYIIDNYGYGDKSSSRFVIAPADNSLVCTCSSCKLLGNTEENASPAVAHLVEKLAQTFPFHHFFLLSYLSTSTPVDHKLPTNVGVIVSAIDLPFNREFEQSTFYASFIQSVDRWKKVSSRIYVWDYINNFDDYLTPFPIMELIAQRFIFYQSSDVKGIFLNGSGYDYSCFDDIHTYVFASLLINPELDVPTLIRNFVADRYSDQASFLGDYIIELERNSGNVQHSLSLYDNLRNASKTYLDVQQFVHFFDRLNTTIPLIKGDERRKLHQLYTALCYTRLEIARNQGIAPLGFARLHNDMVHPVDDLAIWLKALDECSAFSDFNHISESELSISSYILAWRQLLKMAPYSSNLLLSTSIGLPMSTDQSINSDVSLLTDGCDGFTIGYHYGWYISPVDIELKIPAENARKAHHFRMNFLHNSRHRIFPPQRIEIYKDDRLYRTLLPTASSTDMLYTVQSDVDLSDAKRITVKIVRQPGHKSQLATDELYLIP